MSRPVTRIPPVVNAFKELWEAGSDLRFWQVISLLEDCAKRAKRDPYQIEEAEWLEIIGEVTKRVRRDYKQKG